MVRDKEQYKILIVEDDLTYAVCLRRGLVDRIPGDDGLVRSRRLVH
jgi:ActR/RegA family two-component response regulator